MIRRSKLMQVWLHSDLLGVPITLAYCVIFAAAIAIFYFADRLGYRAANLGGAFLIVSILALGAFFLTLAGRNAPESLEGVTSAPADGSHRVLVIANLGLEHSALCAEICQRGERARTEAMIIAPVAASSRLHALTDDIDPELDVAQRRVDNALEILESKGIKASGHPALGHPMDSLLDGLRQFQATEVVMLRGGEPGWEDPQGFVERVRAELGLRVTEVDPLPSDSAVNEQRSVGPEPAESTGTRSVVI